MNLRAFLSPRSSNSAFFLAKELLVDKVEPKTVAGPLHPCDQVTDLFDGLDLDKEIRE